MRVENTTPSHTNSDTQSANKVKAHFNQLRVLFINATELTATSQIQLKHHFIKDIQNEKEFFTSYQQSLDTSDPTRCFKDQLISSRILELIDRVISKLEAKQTPDDFKIEILQFYLIEAFFHHPTQNQKDLLHLGQTSALFSALFSNPDLSLSLCSLDKAQKEPKAFAEYIEKQSKICSLFHELMPHQPTRGEKNQISILHQDLFQATFLAKMILNQLQYGQEEKAKGSIGQLYDAYSLFLDHLTLS